MDTLRMMSVKKGMADPRARSRMVNRAMMTSMKWNARVYEAGMMGLYKVLSKDFLTDLDKAPKLLSKGKLALLPHLSGKYKEVSLFL